MEKFVYVFDEASRDRLLALRYKMLAGDSGRHIYVFLNDGGQLAFSTEEIRFTLSDTLTF